MKKTMYILTFIIIIAALVFPFMNVDKDVAFKDVQAMAKTQMDEGAMKLQDEASLKRSYQVKGNNYKDVISYGPISYMNVEEITVFYQPDEGLRALLLAQSEAHIKAQIKVFEGYGEVQTKMLKASYVEERGQYVICIVSSKSTRISRAFESLF